MTIRTAVVANTQRQGGALLLPATFRDSYLIDDKWLGVGDYSAWQYGKTVQAFRTMFNRHEFAVGDTIELYDFFDRHGATMNLKQIKMIVCATITDEDIALIGYRDRAEWLEQTEGGFPERKAWLLVGDVTVHPLTSEGKQAATLTTTNADTGESETTIVDLRDHGVQ